MGGMLDLHWHMSTYPRDNPPPGGALGFDATRQRALLRPLGLEALDKRGLVALFAACAGLALAWMLWLTARGERSGDPVLRAWHALGRRYARFGLARAAHEPALAWAERIAAARPRDAETLRALSARFVEWRYARRTDGGEDPRSLIRDLRKFRPARSDRMGPSR